MNTPVKSQDAFDWKRQPAASNWLKSLVDVFMTTCEFARVLQRRMRDETGTRLIDWLDHVTVPEADRDRLCTIGYSAIESEPNVFEHEQGIFPKVRLDERRCLAIKVDSVDDFLKVHDSSNSAKVTGASGARFRMATIESDAVDFAVVERHGFSGFKVSSVDLCSRETSELDDLIRGRPREPNDQSSFAAAIDVFEEVENALGRDWACDRFFAAERNYWLTRNLAARTQLKRQERVGLGWANHDHHTYRSSREHFASMISAFERMGFDCRERFYAGREAGWGAQVLEHPVCGIVIFADVDLTPEEIAGDFAHSGLTEMAELGTVGLWCKLHGESFLSAGMHHLECQFDFDAAREQLAAEQIKTMKPFTDFPHLRQAFTEGEVWSVPSARLDALVTAGSITREQAEKFARDGAIGSHLEILERNDGYKGFNQTGVSEIIGKTDPRKQA